MDLGLFPNLRMGCSAARPGRQAAAWAWDAAAECGPVAAVTLVTARRVTHRQESPPAVRCTSYVLPCPVALGAVTMAPGVTTPGRPQMPALTPVAEPPAPPIPPAEPEPLVTDELLVEEISIDGMCGVY